MNAAANARCNQNVAVRKPRLAVIPALLLALAAASAAQAQVATERHRFIDDFRQGSLPTKGYKTGYNVFSQTGDDRHIIFGQRTENFLICDGTATDCEAHNPYKQYSSIAIGTDTRGPTPIHALAVSTGFDQFIREEVSYGDFDHPIDVSAYKLIRVNFLGLTAALNFNVQAVNADGARVDNACNLGEFPRPFSVEFPFTGFVQTGPGILDFANVGAFLFIFQHSDSYGITSIELSDTPHPDAIQCDLAHSGG